MGRGELMSKGLEALEELKELLGKHFILWGNGIFNDERTETIEKSLKVLEIIKKKGIFVNGLIKSGDLGEYSILCLNHGMTELLTQEEYDLLKEVLAQ